MQTYHLKQSGTHQDRYDHDPHIPLMPFPLQSVFNVLNPPQTVSGIVELVMEILVSEQKLNNPEMQSEYFRWGLQAHRNHLTGLHERYAHIRDEFNTHSIEQFEDEIAAQTLLIEKYARVNSRFIRHVVRSSALSIIAQMTDMIHIKGITDQLPTIDELKEMPELLSVILDARPEGDIIGNNSYST